MGALFSVSAQNIPEIKSDELLNRINNGGDTTFVVNFWATWCAPCVKELPLFEEINTKYADQNIKVLLVSVDFKKDVQNKLKTFIDKRLLKSEVLYLDENDPNDGFLNLQINGKESFLQLYFLIQVNLSMFLNLQHLKTMNC